MTGVDELPEDDRREPAEPIGRLDEVEEALDRSVGLTAPLTFTSALLGPSVVGRFDSLTFAAIVSRLADLDDGSSARAVCRRPAIGRCP